MMEKKRGADRKGIRALLGPVEVEKKEEEERKEVKEEEKKKTEEKKEEIEGKEDLIERAVDEALRIPRVSVYSPLTSAFVRYMRMSKPGFDISSFLREIIEKGIREREPDISKRVAEELKKRKVKQIEEKFEFR
mgnify:CR=1 FL=1